jgi:uncharacterized protein YjiS (DUF1127 family)
MTYQTLHHDSRAVQSRFGLSSLGLAGQRSLEAVMSWIERYHARSALMRLDDHMLKDIGLSAADVERETNKPFWRA